MQRLYTKNATGVAPDGRWYAGDINALQDAVAALNDLAQALGVGTISVGENGLQILRYGPGEARISGSLRIDAILRGLGGLVAGTYTTAQRNAIAAGLAPYGILILNTTTNQYEWNKGTDTARNWQPFGFVPGGGAGAITDGDIAANAAIAISKLAGYPNDATKAMWGDGSWHAPLTPPTVAGGNYTLLLSDVNKIVEMTGAGTTLTVPPNSAVAFPIGSSITVGQYGGGQVGLAAGAGVTLRSYNGNLHLGGQYAVAGLIKRGTDEWWAAGNLVP